MIKFNDLYELIETGYDIEFSYKGIEYSITKTSEDKVSFCEFYKEPTNYDSIEDFMKYSKIDKVLLSDIWESVTDLYY